MKVLFVVIDTLRADHLGCYGYHRNTSPRLDALAKEGVLFERAYATDVPTQPSYTAMFTGQRGIRSGVVSHSPTEGIPDSTPYLPHILAMAGYETAAVSTLYFMKKYFARGFHTYINPVAHDRQRTQQITAEEVNSYALPWLRANYQKDFFLFVHYWDPHGLYKAPEEKYRTMFYKGDKSDPNNHSLDALNDQLIGLFVRQHIDNLGENITDAEYVIAQYDGEIRYVDTKFGELLDVVKDLGIEGETLLIVTADHGESMTEHDLFFDHFGVYEPTIHVPLIVRWPHNVPSGRQVRALVQGIDIPATILDAAGIELPETFQGRSLLPLARGETEGGYEFIFSNQGLWQAKRVISDGRWKLIKALDNGFWPAPALELYDLDSDPGELNNLVEKESHIAADLELRLRRWEDAQLKGRVDPLREIVSLGLPPKPWIKDAARRKGIDIVWEDFRNLIDVPFKEQAEHQMDMSSHPAGTS
jgi:arylsulfatase